MWCLPPITGLTYRHLHFGKGFGVERLCDDTTTVLGPGFLSTRVGRHFVLVAIINSSLNDRFKPICSENSYYSRHLSEGNYLDLKRSRHHRISLLLAG